MLVGDLLCFVYVMLILFHYRLAFLLDTMLYSLHENEGSELVSPSCVPAVAHREVVSSTLEFHCFLPLTSVHVYVVQRHARGTSG
jgi:hypothetical protein